MPVYRPDVRFLRHAITSVFQQTVDDWQLIVVDDASNSPEVDRVISWACEDPRVTAVRLAENLGISGASNAGFAHVEAPLVALLDHDDFLEPEALAEVLRAASHSPEAEVIYTDRDAVDESNTPTEVFLKPDWSPERLRGNMYIAHLTSLSAEAIREVGGFHSEFDGAQDHDLVLRITERGKPVVHIPRVLYHWRQLPHSTALSPEAKPYADKRGRAAVQAHRERQQLPGVVRHSGFPGFYVTDRDPIPTLASIIIPTRGGAGHVHGADRVFAVEAVRSIVQNSYVTDYEIVIVHDAEADDGYLLNLSELARDRLRVVSYTESFNFSAKANLGATKALGDVLVFLNDDIEVQSPHWLDQMVAIAQEPGVGAVGAKLFFEDGTIQHAGHFFHGGQVGHISARSPDSPGHYGSNLIDREVVGVTAACMAVRRDVWRRVAGMDEALPNNFNDVDFCYRLRAKGYRIVQANNVRLTHFESKTRQPSVASWEARRIMERLGDQLFADPFTSAQAAQLSPAHRSAREWIRVTGVVLRDEGIGSVTSKARRRLKRS